MYKGENNMISNFYSKTLGICQGVKFYVLSPARASGPF